MKTKQREDVFAKAEANGDHYVSVSRNALHVQRMDDELLNLAWARGWRLAHMAGLQAAVVMVFERVVPQAVR